MGCSVNPEMLVSVDVCRLPLPTRAEMRYVCVFLKVSSVTRATCSMRSKGFARSNGHNSMDVCTVSLMIQDAESSS